ncbi:MAG: VOC family protein [bacterium]|nr:VOC family protein [bacterium]
MSDARFPRLHPVQVCFVVDDVETAVAECVDRFGWGPFHQFSAPVPEARYHDWVGAKETDVALGMAGGVQVELIHVRKGHDTVGAYQARYGTGFQHLGISCKDREAAVEALEGVGARLDDAAEYPGIRFAFIDTPTGPGMFELLQETGDTPPPGEDAKEGAGTAAPPGVLLDRATIVTDDLDRARAFHAAAFRWDGVGIETVTLRIDGIEERVRRVRGPAGQLELELIEAMPEGAGPYARHLARGDHGLAHAGGVAADGGLPDGAAHSGEWLEDGERFALYAWSGGSASLQIRA